MATCESIENKSKEITDTFKKKHETLERKYNNQLDKKYAGKEEVSTRMMNTALYNMEKRVENMKKLTSNQMDKLEERQAKLVNENDMIYKYTEFLKLEIAQLKSQRETVQDEYTQTQNKIIGNKYDEDTKEYGFNFMKKYQIDSRTKNRQPNLRPFQFLYPKENHYTREVEIHKFQKANLNV